MKTIAVVIVAVIVVVAVLVVLATVPAVAEQTHDTVSCGGIGFGLTSRSFPSGTNVNIYWTTGPSLAIVTLDILGGSITSPAVYSHTGSSDATQLHSNGGTYWFDCLYTGNSTASPDVSVTENFTAPIL